MIPPHLERNFQEIHINLVWDELAMRFGFNLKEWKKKYKQQFSYQPRNVSEVEFFLRFGNKAINPVLNEILGRQNLYPTFNRLVDYILDLEGKRKNKQSTAKSRSGYTGRL